MKFVIFDIDGTLADTKKVDDRCFITAFYQTFNIDISDEKWENLKNVTDWGITEEIIGRELKRKPEQSEYGSMISNLANLLRAEREKDASQFSEVKGANHFFHRLKSDANYGLGIATGAWSKSAEIKLESIGIHPDGICFSNSDHHKSREEITKNVINQLEKKTDRKTKEVIYFGDGLWDYKTCRNLGIRFIGIDVLGDGKLKSMGAEAVFSDYSNVDKIMSEIEKEW